MCNLHPGKTYERVFSDGDICIECTGLKLTLRCPRCRSGVMVRGWAECSCCGEDAAVFHQGRAYWLEPNGNADRQHKEVIYTLYIGFGLVAASLVVAGLTFGRAGQASDTETTVIKDNNGNSYQVEPYIRKGSKGNCEVMAVWSLTEPRPAKPLATFTLPGMPECGTP